MTRQEAITKTTKELIKEINRSKGMEKHDAVMNYDCFIGWLNSNQESRIALICKSYGYGY